MGRQAAVARLTRGALPALAATVLAGTLAAGAAGAAEVRFPLTLDYELIRAAIRRHLHEEAGGRLQVRSGDGCQTLTLRDLTVDPAPQAGRVRLSARGTGQVGLPFLGLCWGQVDWDGYLDVTGRPEIDPTWQVRLVELDTQLYDRNRRQGGIATRVWDLARGWAERELAAFSYDLGPPVEELRQLLGTFSAASRTTPLATTLASLRPVGVTVDRDAVRIVVALDVPVPAAPATRAPEPAPTAEELRRWQAALDGWDGFVAFAVKDLASGTGGTVDATLEAELLDVLVEARRGLVAALDRGPEGGVDPVRGLFLDTWERLRAVVRRLALRGGAESRGLRYFAFLAAGDALAAIETAAPAAGLELSVDGLRRLARALDPSYRGDPVETGEQLDPTLRRIFRFRDPDAPPRRAPRPRPGGFDWLRPRPAYADAASEEWASLGRRLDRWVPIRAELPAYRATVERLLVTAADRSWDPELLDGRFEDLFFHLVQAVAWQESCWRQFVRKDGEVVPLVSRSGDVGMMQVNRRVWRGFFDVQRLTWSSTYNAGAGTEILLQLLTRYGVREAVPRDHAARASYSAYHGGPRSYRRYRTPQVAPALQAVDRAFWDKYQLVAIGRADDRVLCMG